MVKNIAWVGITEEVGVLSVLFQRKLAWDNLIKEEKCGKEQLKKKTLNIIFGEVVSCASSDL